MNQNRIDELTEQIKQNAADYFNGNISYEELYALQIPLIKERDELINQQN